MAMARRAHELGRLSDWEYRCVCSELTSRGYRATEPDGIPAERSKVFPFIARTNQVKGVSTSTVSEETGLTAKELHDLSFGSLLYASGNGVAKPGLGARPLRPKLTLHVNNNYHELQ